MQDEQRAYAAELAAYLRRALPAAPAAVLDVGGSTGVVAAAFAGPDVRPTVLDPAPDELAVAAAAGMETIEGFAEDFDPGDRRWDLVLLCQTIDHLLDVARHAARDPRPAGRRTARAFVDVLDVSWVLARQRTIEGAYKVDHPFYLTRATALGLLRRRPAWTSSASGWPTTGTGASCSPPASRPSPTGRRSARAADAFLAEVWRRRAQAR